MFRKKIIYIIIYLLLFTLGTAYAADNSVPVRVGISNTNFNTYLFSSIEFNDCYHLIVMDASSGYTIPIKENYQILKVTSENNLFRIYLDNELVAKNLTGPIFVSPKVNHLLSIKDLKRKGKQALYRGYIELVRSDKDKSKFAVVNVLNLKNYLRGVVPNEMPVRFGLEALKAQSVAARNYAVTPRIKAYSEFDLCDSVACQVYFGANTEDELSDKAIEETNGIIAIDKEEKPILALYSSTAGGYTESYEYAFSDPKTKVFPSNDIEYLSAVPDKKDFEPLDNEESAIAFYTSKPESFDDMSPYYRWSKEWTKSELEEVLSETLVAQSKTGFVTPMLTNPENFGKLKNIQVIRRGQSGKIIELEIITDKNIFNVKKELVIRRCFQKNGISLPSANFVISYIDSLTPVFKFSGGGFGHGVGLSQWGAGKMGSLGYSYDQILKHYYKGIKLSTISIPIYTNQKMTDRLFFMEYEKACLIINNPENIHSMIVYINGKELNIKLKNGRNEIDISKYLKKGENKISYMISDETADYKKSIQVRIEVKEDDNE